MRAALFGCGGRPALAVIGSWDPFVRAHRRLMRELSRRARLRSLTSLAIVLDPHPARFIHGLSE
jgi:hypothetical protein